MHDLVEEAPALKYLQQEDLLSPGTSACIGCPVELALRFTLRVLGKDVLLFTAPGCAETFTLGLGSHAQVKLAQFPALLTNVASLMTGARRYYEHVGRSVKVVAFVGDGALQWTLAFRRSQGRRKGRRTWSTSATTTRAT